MALGPRAILSGRLPIRLGHSSEPQPDLAVLKPRDDFYDREHPHGGDVLLLIEVSVTSLRYDLQAKIPLYARHLIPEVWVIDLQDQKVHLHRKPRGGAYTEILSLAESGSLLVAAFPDVVVDVGAVLRS